MDQAKHRGRMGVICRTMIVVALLGFFAASGRAGSVSYGDQGPVAPGITFTNIMESSGTDPVPLYGPPTAFATGLDFDPVGFVAFGSGGASDVTDGQLNFAVHGDPNIGINSLNLLEAGDYTLAGTGTPATQDFVGAIMRITVTQIDGVNVAPINLAPSNSSVAFNLIANPGIVQPWSLAFSLNVASQLTSMGISFHTGATALEVVIDNELIALSEANSAAEIAKKDFRINVGTTPVPEPATFVLLGLGGLMTSTVWLRRRGGVRA
jgi:hypothetical protein